MRIFIAYAREDLSDGYRAFIDRVKALLGQAASVELCEQLESADLFVALCDEMLCDIDSQMMDAAAAGKHVLTVMSEDRRGDDEWDELMSLRRVLSKRPEKAHHLGYVGIPGSEMGGEHAAQMVVEGILHRAHRIEAALTSHGA